MNEARRGHRLRRPAASLAGNLLGSTGTYLSAVHLVVVNVGATYVHLSRQVKVLSAVITIHGGHRGFNLSVCDYTRPPTDS
jgi:hypothetical protein